MGPVDFKFSTGYSKRVLLEVKLAHNTKLWNGLQRQLPRYTKEIFRSMYENEI